VRCRLSFGEAVSQAVVPGANITDIMVSMESKFRMVLTAFNNNDLYRQLFWARLGYTPANGTKQELSQAAGGSSAWRQQYTAGNLAVRVHGAVTMFCTLQCCTGVAIATVITVFCQSDCNT
jgi:hypothetical protein